MPQFDTYFFSSLIFWEIVSFAILFLVLYKFAFPPILQALELRERKIRESLEQAEGHRADAEQKLRDYEAKLAAASPIPINAAAPDSIVSFPPVFQL